MTYPSSSPGIRSSDTAGLDLDLSGRQLGDYRLLRRLGRGAMADVYLAEQGSLRRQVAFKVLKRELAADQTYVRRFHGEAQAAASLVHANIVQIYEVGNVEGIHYIAQEYVEGQNLAQFLSRHGPPDVKLSLAVMRQVTAALCKSADRGIVHRDIKPENIMLARSGEVKVADFGLARVTASDDSLKLTQVGITMGTPLYMSPEQVENRPLDARSDLYSLGVTCYHMIVGQPPFRGENAMSVALQHVRTRPERIENQRPDFPPAVCRVVHRLLEKDPSDRYATPRELLKELRSLKIDGVDLQWPEELDELNAVEASTLLALRGEATQRLQQVMQTQALVTQSNRRWWWSLLGVLLAAMAIGAGVAWATREPFLLDVPSEQLPRVEPMRTAQDQYDFARMSETEASWQAVIDNFGDDREQQRWVNLAKIELAKRYLLGNDFDDAKQLFRELAGANDNNSTLERRFRATAAAGLAFIFALEKKQSDSVNQLLELQKLAGSLNRTEVGNVLGDASMEQLVRDAMVTNRETIGEQNQQAMETWLNENRGETEPLEPQ